MRYYIKEGVIVPFAKKYKKFVISAVAGIFIFTQFIILMQFSGAVTSEVVYDALPPTVPSTNYPSYGLQAHSIGEFGDQVTLGGTNRILESVTVTMSNWAKESANTTWCDNNPDKCTDEGFIHPITANVYAADGTVLESSTQESLIPWRPESNPSCGSTSNGNGWRENGECINVSGLATNVTINFTGTVVMPDEIKVGITYPVQSDRTLPGLGVAGPYNSLNITFPPSNVMTPTVGSDSDPETANARASWTDGYDGDFVAFQTWQGAQCNLESDPVTCGTIALRVSASGEEVDYTENGKIWICHAPRTDKFLALNVNVNGAESGHGTGNGTHSDDIVPPFGDFEGLNWTAENQEYWLENCDGRGEVIGDVTCEQPVAGFAFNVYGSDQGTKKNDTAITGARAETVHVLGAPDATTSPDDGFFALGEEGWITVEFDDYFVDVTGDDLTIHEVTNGRTGYPEENALVEISQDGTNWLDVGTASSKDADGESSFDISGTGLAWAKYVRVSDTTNFDLHISTADGYDVDAIGAAAVCPEAEEEPLEPCEVGTDIFMIGDIELLQTDHPADEFTGSGNAGDFTVNPADPFVAGGNTDEEFPWNSNFSQSYGTDFEVQFNYAGSETVEATLIVAWSPGKSAVENKVVSLDDVVVANFSHNGTNVAGWYNNSQVFEDEIDLTVAPGNHTLRFQHTSGDGTYWDFVRLQISDCGEEDEDGEVQGENDTRLGSISGLIYHDINSNGKQNGDEPAMEGWNVLLLTRNSPYTVKAIDTTGSDGLFLFEDLAFGTYYVCQDLQTGWLQTELEASGTGMDWTDLDVGELIPGDDETIDALVKKYCYIVELTEEDPNSVANVFGNARQQSNQGQAQGNTGVLAAVTGGNVLADTDTLAATGQPTLLYIAAGVLVTVTTLGVYVLTKR